MKCCCDSCFRDCGCYCFGNYYDYYSVDLKDGYCFELIDEKISKEDDSSAVAVVAVVVVDPVRSKR